MGIPTAAKLEKTCQLFQVDIMLLHMREIRDTVPLKRIGKMNNSLQETKGLRGCKASGHVKPPMNLVP